LGALPLKKLLNKLYRKESKILNFYPEDNPWEVITDYKGYNKGNWDLGAALSVKYNITRAKYSNLCTKLSCHFYTKGLSVYSLGLFSEGIGHKKSRKAKK
jgi:hypothetical protein